MTPADVEADRLAAVAVQLVSRVREDQPTAVWRWLGHQLPDPTDWFRLTIILAAAVPDNRSWLTLASWRDPDERRWREREKKARWRAKRREVEAT